ncbi:hypothetical protein TSUD_53450 [Trifolium subterraneum]|uniref:DUF4283 domain-containing protein n=1 Tax=Trifolium subterraneum TaxID=3900 RepID=A0A2Z6NQ66_TRISU|nr:hypothetical protein TSUD_53450 [Trifolium subterraneum]
MGFGYYAAVLPLCSGWRVCGTVSGSCFGSVVMARCGYGSHDSGCCCGSVKQARGVRGRKESRHKGLSGYVRAAQSELNVSKFGRDSHKATSSLESGSRPLKGGAAIAHPGRSFLDVISNRAGISMGISVADMQEAFLPPPPNRKLEFEVDFDRLHNLKKCLVGHLLKDVLLVDFMDRLVLEGFHEITVIPLGGGFVLLKSLVDGVLSSFSEFIKSSKLRLLRKVEPWSPNLIATEREVWLSCWGVPPHCWCNEFFSKLVVSFGELVSIDVKTLLEADFVKGRIFVRILVSSCYVNEVVNVSTKEGCFPVRVLEEVWVNFDLPSFDRNLAPEDVGRIEGKKVDRVVVEKEVAFAVQMERESDKKQLSAKRNNMEDQTWDKGNRFSALATLDGDVFETDGESDKRRSLLVEREFLGEKKWASPLETPHSPCVMRMIDLEAGGPVF